VLATRSRQGSGVRIHRATHVAPPANLGRAGTAMAWMAAIAVPENDRGAVGPPWRVREVREVDENPVITGRSA
jgi:hypothetical protein